MHDGRVGSDGPSDWVLGVVEVYDDHLGRLADLLAHANELVRLHGERAEADVGHVDADVLQLNVLLELDGQRAACWGSHRHSVLFVFVGSVSARKRAFVSPSS